VRKLVDLMSLKDRVVLITGGAGHIGSVLAETFAELGANVAVLDRDKAEPENIVDKLSTDFPTKAIALAVDLADDDALHDVPARVVDGLGGLDVLVNCAAFVGTDDLAGWAVPIEEQKISTWRDAVNVNLTAPFFLIQQSLPYLRKSGHGSVINIGSIYGLLGPDWSIYEGVDFGTPAAYAASKGGLMQLTRWLATTLAPKVRVNAIVPGGVARATPKSFDSRYIARTPMKRMATEEDMKGAAMFLASDLSSYVTGQCLIVDGGWSAW